MLDFLDRLLGQTRQAPAGPRFERHHLAAAALLVEAGLTDGRFGEAERARVRELLADRFGLGDAVASALLERAEVEARDAVEWHGFTNVLKQAYDAQGRMDIVEMLWEVVLADGRIDDYEASLMRRVAGLLYVSDGDSAEARERARQRLAEQP
jgi:uncharacterized tellurite resistance protein B-like protein